MLRFRAYNKMKVLFINGSPATGKLVIARALLKKVDGRLMDNHAVIDFAKTIFEFGAPGFWDLVHVARLTALRAAAKQNVPLVVMTFCYSHPSDLTYFRDFECLMAEEGSELLPAHLNCSDQEIARRIGNPDRIERGKTSSTQAIAAFSEVYHDAEAPADDCLRLDTERTSAEATADKIVQAFGLVPRPESSRRLSTAVEDQE